MKQLPIWRVIVGGFGEGPRPYNVFVHGGFFNSVCEIMEEYRRTMRAEGQSVLSVTKWHPGQGAEIVNLSPRDFVSYKLRGHALYYFWSKCEWEIVVSEWPNNTKGSKIDVFTQLRLNWDEFINYVIAHASSFPPPTNKDLIDRMLTNYRNEHRKESFDAYRI